LKGFKAGTRLHKVRLAPQTTQRIWLLHKELGRRVPDGQSCHRLAVHDVGKTLRKLLATFGATLVDHNVAERRGP
tara:strand:+ start:554 stop:778 length:225 start_codon:yes stop_codon:yes gene_type:complete